MIDRILRRGTKGDDVKELQQALGILVDGYFGPVTEAAVRTLQTKTIGLIVDGVVGPRTVEALRLPVPIKPDPKPRPVPTYATLSQVDAHFEKGTAAWYQAAYLIMDFDAGMRSRVEADARRVLSHKPMYVELERLRGIPWAMTGLIHSMECNNNPRGVLHNGELIVGTGRKTTLVPRGRGPFATWLEAALDAVDSEALWRVPAWTVGYILKQCEAFNGLGYLRYHHNENSPYLWACTTINDGTGKYVSDGVWSETANANTQVGAAAILRQLELLGEVDLIYA